MWSTIGVLLPLLVLGECRSLPEAPNPSAFFVPTPASTAAAGPTGHGKATAILAGEGAASRRSRRALISPAPHAARRGVSASHALHERASDWQYVGCITDGSNRALPSYYADIGDLTPAKCQARCESVGYILAGMQYGRECYCANAIGGNGQTRPESECSMSCAGDSSRKCGGDWRLSLYKDAATQSSPIALGCYLDSSDRTLNGISPWINGNMNVALCNDYCGQRGFNYAGVQYGNECYCGKTAPAASRKKPDSECNMRCAGGGVDTCGGSWRINIQQLAGAASGSSSSSSSSTSSTPATPQATLPPLKELPGDIRSLGCFRDATQQGFGAGTTTSSNQPSTCLQYCQNKGYNLAGLSGNSCTCSNSMSWSSKDSDSACSTRCGGDQGYICGGSSRTSILTLKSASDLVSGTAQPVGSGRKFIWAHHMIGNLEGGGVDMWKEDIRMAAAAGIDGFALNMGQAGWQVDRVIQAYQAAAELKSSVGDFKMFLSFDMTAMYCGGESDARYLADIVSRTKGLAQQAMYKDKVLVTTFAGDACRFGRGSANDGWSFFRSLLTAKNTPIYLMPSIFVEPFGAQNSWYDGHYEWDSAWPLGAGNLDGSRDQWNIDSLKPKNKGYMANISPAFFTYYPPPPAPYGWNKNWIYRSDNWLLATRFEQLMGIRDQLDMIELTSWNDFGESHYVGPIRTEQPGSQAWVNGMPHTGWLNIVAYYAQAWKTGSYPAATDQLILWSRPHPKNGTPSAPKQGMSRPRNADYTDDNLYALAILASPGDVTIRSGSSSVTHRGLAAGVHKLSLASKAGTIGGTIARSGSNVKNWDSSSSEFSWSTSFRDWNFNYFVKAI